MGADERVDRSRLLYKRALFGAGDKMTMSEALRHLGIADHDDGRLEEARPPRIRAGGMRGLRARYRG